MNSDRIEVLVQKVHSIPDSSARDAALELLQAVMELHAEALDKMMELVAGSAVGDALLDQFSDDPAVSGILLLHNLHPLDLSDRVTKALADPAFRTRGAKVELLSIDNGAVRVRIEGGEALRTAVEEALAGAAPDAASIIVEGGVDRPSSGFVPLTQLLA